MPPPVNIAAHAATTTQLPSVAPAGPENHQAVLLAAKSPVHTARAPAKSAVKLAALPARRSQAHHPVPASRIELPRWLTEDHPTPERGLVMSEPPHDLTLPAQWHAPLMVASTATTQLPPLREPGYRPVPSGATW